MCTTYLTKHIIDKLENNDIEIVGLPHLVRLNPFARFKTRGNGAVSFKIKNNENVELAKKIVLDEVKYLSMFDCENTNPGVVFYSGKITKEMIDYSFKAIYSIISIKEAE
jgi:tRNA(Ile2)-agmatinylcytidine synthase